MPRGRLRRRSTVMQSCRSGLLTASAVPRRSKDGMCEALEDEEDERQDSQSPDAHQDEERAIFPAPAGTHLEELRSEGAGTFPSEDEALSRQIAPGDHFGAAGSRNRRMGPRSSLHGRERGRVSGWQDRR